MGAGKTWMGQQISLLTGYSHHDLDACIEEAEGMDISALFKKIGEDQFRVVEQKCLHELIAANSNLLLSCGGGTPCFFDNIDFMKKNGTVIWLDPPISVLFDRLKVAYQSRPLLNNNFEPKQLEEYIHLKLAERTPFYKQAHFRIQDVKPDPLSLIKLIQHG